LINNINILQTGDGWLGIEKPCGVSVHNDPGKDVISIVAKMIENGQINLLTDVKQDKIRIQPVHRLDKSTSGVLLLAYNPDTIKELSNYFFKGLVQKQYFALVHGNFEDTENKLFTWEYPLTKEAGGRNNPAGNGKKVAAKTCFKIIKQSSHYSLLEIQLITGRKHQIRRHAKLDGHPVLSDKRYGSKKSIQYLSDNLGYDRLGLHAHSIVIQDKESPISIFSQGIPEKMNDLLTQDKIIE